MNFILCQNPIPSDNSVSERPEELHYAKNPAWEGSCLDSCPEKSGAWYVCDNLFKSADGYVKIMHKDEEVRCESYLTSELRNPYKVASIFGQKELGKNNLYVSVGTYRSIDSYEERNLLTINAICIDVDYRKSHDKRIRALSADDAVRMFYADILLSGYIPMPTYIEVGRNFRLVYVLDRPYGIPKRRRDKALSFIEYIGDVIGRKIMEQEDWAVDKFQVAPMVRIPESINLRCNEDTGRREKYEVSLMPDFQSQNLWDVNRLADTVLPPLSEHHKKGKKSRKPSRRQNAEMCAYSLDPTRQSLQKRLEDLKKFQAYLGAEDVGHREKMVYLFRLTAVQAGMSETDALNAALDFNSYFAHPLRVSEVKSRCKPRDYKQKFKNLTIRETLGCPDDLHLFEGSLISEKDRYYLRKEKKIADGTLVPKKEQLEQLYEKIIQLKGVGKKNRQIAKELNLPERTLTRYLKTIRDRQKAASLPQPYVGNENANGGEVPVSIHSVFSYYNI